jgi:uncharacterized protein
MKSIFTENRTALITGASAGIGFELTKLLAHKLNSLVVVARRAERLTQLANELQTQLPKLRVVVESADLSNPDAVENLLRRLDEHRGRAGCKSPRPGFPRGEGENFFLDIPFHSAA